jgi:hypothetical protein
MIMLMFSWPKMIQRHWQYRLVRLAKSADWTGKVTSVRDADNPWELQ